MLAPLGCNSDSPRCSEVRFWEAAIQDFEQMTATLKNPYVTKSIVTGSTAGVPERSREPLSEGGAPENRDSKLRHFVGQPHHPRLLLPPTEVSAWTNAEL